MSTFKDDTTRAIVKTMSERDVRDLKKELLYFGQNLGHPNGVATSIYEDPIDTLNTLRLIYIGTQGGVCGVADDDISDANREAKTKLAAAKDYVKWPKQ